MCEFTDYAIAQSIMGKNLVLIDEIKCIEKMPFEVRCDEMIPYSQTILEERCEDYYLLPGASQFCDGHPVTIRSFVELFGKNPDISEPCFYNQDWYERESFIDIQMNDKWYFIRKSVFSDSRAVQPEELIMKYSFPSAIECTYSFFVLWFVRHVKMWEYDFVWCKDLDHNGDRIYVGKYNDVDGMNKNGFSIHRHLGLRDCYGCIDS